MYVSWYLGSKSRKRENSEKIAHQIRWCYHHSPQIFSFKWICANLPISILTSLRRSAPAPLWFPSTSPAPSSTRPLADPPKNMWIGIIAFISISLSLSQSISRWSYLTWNCQLLEHRLPLDVTWIFPTTLYSMNFLLTTKKPCPGMNLRGKRKNQGLACFVLVCCTAVKLRDPKIDFLRICLSWLPLRLSAFQASVKFSLFFADKLR